MQTESKAAPRTKTPKQIQLAANLEAGTNLSPNDCDTFTKRRQYQLARRSVRKQLLRDHNDLVLKFARFRVESGSDDDLIDSLSSKKSLKGWDFSPNEVQLLDDLFFVRCVGWYRPADGALYDVQAMELPEIVRLLNKTNRGKWSWFLKAQQASATAEINEVATNG